MPAQRSIISKDPSALEANVEHLLRHITLDSDKKIFLSHLGDLERQPGQKLSYIKYDLDIIYQNYMALEQLSAKSNKVERRRFERNPTAVSNTEENTKKVRRLTYKALVTLFSIEAQNNISNLIKAMANEDTLEIESLEEAIQKWDKAYPLKNIM